MDEQKVFEAEEFDGLDSEALHFLAWHHQQAAGTARLRFVNGWAKLERIAVRQEFRGLGLGAALVKAMLAEAKFQGIYRYTLGAQTYALGFYEKLGFTAIGEEFMDAGIPHRQMQRQDQPSP